MKPSTILATLLPTLALASPAIKTPAVPQQAAIVPDPIIFDPPSFDPFPVNLKRSNHAVSAELGKLDDLLTCLRNHKDFEADFTRANNGIFSIRNLDPTCCQKGKDFYYLIPPGQFGQANFAEPCEGALVTQVGHSDMEILRSLVEEVTKG